MIKRLRLLVLVLLVSGCPLPMNSSVAQRCAEACGDIGVQKVTRTECHCHSPPDASSAVPLNPVGC